MNQTTTETERKIHARQEKLHELLRQKGVKPLQSIKDLQGDFWPEDESVDEFLEWVKSD